MLVREIIAGTGSPWEARLLQTLGACFWGKVLWGACFSGRTIGPVLPPSRVSAIKLSCARAFLPTERHTPLFSYPYSLTILCVLCDFRNVYSHRGVLSL